jgi:L-proline---[L-prolyl-carrier protein] ligase
MCQTLHELLIRTRESNPDRTAVVGVDSTLSYADLLSAATSLAESLVAAGIVPGDRVGLCMPKTCDAIVAVYGILLSGACYVPIDPTAPIERAVQIANNVKERALVFSQDKAKLIAPAIAERLDKLDVFLKNCEASFQLQGCAMHDWSAASVDGARLPQVEADSLAYILHTSGSTGKPKGVAISHKSALTFVNMAAEFFSIHEDDRLGSQAPLHFDLSVFDLYVACRQGARLILMPEYYSAFPKKFVSAIREHKISIWNSVPSAIALILEKGQPDPEDLRSIRLVLFSGEAMPARYLRMMREVFANAELYNGYGQTEANTSMYYRVESIPPDERPVPIGKAFPAYDVFALDKDGKEIDQPGQTGELFVSSEAVADGYFGNQELTDTKFQFNAFGDRISTRVFRTGDTVCINNDGDYEFVGRADDLVKSRGYRIEIGEIEQALVSCPTVSSAACIAIADEQITNRLIGFVTCSDGTQCTETEVSRYLRGKLPEYMVPEQIIVMDKLPTTSTGKIDRNGLRSELSCISAYQT